MHAPADLPPPSTSRLRSMLEVKLGLLELADRLRQNWVAHAAAAGLSTAQVNALVALTPGEPVPMRALATRLDYDASNLSVLVDRLENRGLVDRHPDPDDRRVKALVLTADGERVRAAFWSELVADPQPLDPLSDADLRSLAVLLGTLGIS
ncbi:MAG: MarR family winged helix-turn-helix transcriptional regulator [Streptosporangiaceae bacterium]|jgi:DNA-binding MarR family transcriptional regulator